MGTEVKINQQPIEKSLADLQASLNSTESSFPKDFQGENMLETVNKLHKINASLEEALTSYKTLLHQNEASTREAMEALVEVDRELASSYRLLR